MADTMLDYARDAYYETYRAPAWDDESCDGGRDDDDLSDGEQAALALEDDMWLNTDERIPTPQYAAYLAAEANDYQPMDLGPRDKWLTKIEISDCGHWVGDLCPECCPF